ncbi:type II secretion system F family protein [Demequina sp. SO4-18]|uniref:type II secretion system F family protein n=1 Tax=Demequina sp. SO4-18 TaxID=3401026 RepID=UPI003B59530C
MTWLTLVLGGALGMGAALVLAWGGARRATLEARISPYLRTTVADDVARREQTVTPMPALERLLAPVVRDAGRMISRWGSPAADVSRRLRRSGSGLSVEQFRAQQVVWGAAGLAAGVALALLLTATRGAPVLASAVLALVLAAAGVLGRDAALSHAVTRRQRRLVAELPTIAELLALSVAAGESALAALERVARTTSGELTRELAIALADARAGERLPAALTRMAREMSVPALERFAEGIATALERGTPLAEVLRAQAQDARSQGRQALVEEGGRREIAMMVPVVFLILPVTVVFAVFPGLVAIDLGG